MLLQNRNPETLSLRSSLRRACAARALLRSRLDAGAPLVRLRRLCALGLARLVAFAAALRLLLADGLDSASRRPPGAVGERLLARRAVLRLELVVDELQDGRLRRIALAGAEAKDPSVAARTVDEPRRDRLEHPLDGRAIRDPARDPAPRGDAVGLRQRDEL